MALISGADLVVTIRQFSKEIGKLLSTANELNKSPDGALAVNRAIEAATADLVESINNLMSSEIKNDATLKILSDSSSCQAREILQILGLEIGRASCRERV